eukprot:TRINITY_DN783_c0_g3_i1.p1 TRINITY_DN783_c0_g3~~TRINITY_DN783_c0_g3_i1.p1  ORF type:complete len:192 (-),score=13.85 TRINITY_DN783_c0_g3_i1:309-884(-)
MSIILVIFIRVLILPTLYISIKPFHCPYIEDCTFFLTIVTSCSGGVHIILIILASINILITLFLSIFVACFYADESPKSDLPWALSDARMRLIKVTKLTFSAVILSSDFYEGSFVVCMITFFLLDAFLLYSQLTTASYLHRVPQALELVSSTTTGFFAICFVALNELDVYEFRRLMSSLICPLSCLLLCCL